MRAAAPSTARALAIVAAAVLITGTIAAPRADGASERDPRAALYPTLPEEESLTEDGPLAGITGGEPANGDTETEVAVHEGRLPFTGADLALALVVSCALISTGVALRRSSRKPSS